MGGNPAGRYVAVGQVSLARAPWWQRFPRPIDSAAVRAWGALPGFVRIRLVPLGRLFGTHSVAVPTSPGPDAVPGVSDLVGQGFEPIENYTGAVWVAALWPEVHRRNVADTRAWVLEWPESDGRLWLIRSPWDALPLTEVFAVMWRWAERDHTHDEQVLRDRVAEVLAWPESRVTEQLRTLPDL